MRKDTHQEVWLTEERRPLIDRGVEIFFNRLGGWESLDMVMRYTKALGTEDAIKAHKRFSPGDRLL
jgi:hypothetical protein